MTKLNDRPDKGAGSAIDEVTAATELFDGVRKTLEDMAQLIQNSEGTIPARMKLKLSEIHTTLIWVRKAKENLDAIQNQADDAKIDFTSIRDDIGRKIDRIRATLDSEGISEKPD